MDFTVSEINKDIAKLAADYAMHKLAPSAQERDEEEVFDRSLLNEMGKLGLLGIPYPEEYGGAGADFIALTMACEEIK